MAPPLNPLWPAAGPPETCERCAWAWIGGRGRPVARCRRHGDRRLDPRWPACPAWTGPLDCTACAACCREAYHTVELGPREPFVGAHPALVVHGGGRIQLPRRDGRCPCLAGEAGAWRCFAYEERPRSCRDFAQGGAHCLDARRRLGLTP